MFVEVLCRGAVTPIEDLADVDMMEISRGTC